MAGRDDHGSLIRAAPGLARIAAEAYLRSARWGVRASVHATERMVRALTEPEDATERRAEPATPAQAAEADREQARKSLRERGEELLRRSADVNLDEGAHPAYMRILEDLSPDEARILRLLYESGPQPSVDVRSGLLPLQSTTELVEAGLNMIGPEAGARHLHDVPAYLNNLFRLGLVWFSREPVPEQRAYQVLEAQPEVAQAMEKARHARTVRRSILLTPFGRDFCELCLVDSARQPGEPDPAEDRDGRG
jgi:Abortive infection alpha